MISNGDPVKPETIKVRACHLETGDRVLLSQDGSQGVVVQSYSPPTGDWWCVALDDGALIHYPPGAKFDRVVTDAGRRVLEGER